MLRTERFYFTLTSERPEAGNDDLFNMHRFNRSVDAPKLTMPGVKKG